MRAVVVVARGRTVWPGVFGENDGVHSGGGVAATAAAPYAASCASYGAAVLCARRLRHTRKPMQTPSSATTTRAATRPPMIGPAELPPFPSSSDAGGGGGSTVVLDSEPIALGPATGGVAPDEPCVSAHGRLTAVHTYCDVLSGQTPNWCNNVSASAMHVALTQPRVSNTATSAARHSAFAMDPSTRPPFPSMHVLFQFSTVSGGTGGSP